MIRHIWSILCESSAFDVESGKVSLFNVIENLQVLPKEDGTLPQGPITLPIPMQIVSLWSRTDPAQPVNGVVRLVLCNPEDKCEKQIEVGIDLSKGFFHHTRLQANSITLQGPGMYKFVVELRVLPGEAWTPVSTIPLLVHYGIEVPA